MTCLSRANRAQPAERILCRHTAGVKRRAGQSGQRGGRLAAQARRRPPPRIDLGAAAGSGGAGPELGPERAILAHLGRSQSGSSPGPTPPAS
jgi:hypothetical protein